MADPKDNNNTSSDDYEDEFDAMLKAAQLLRDEKGKFFDKNDPIEQLLVDTGLDIDDEEEEENNEYDKQKSSFIEEAIPASGAKKNVENKQSNPMQNIDKNAELADNKNEIDGVAKNMTEHQPSDDSAMDFLMADFDISADDELANLDKNIAEDSVNELYSQAEKLGNKIATEKADGGIKAVAAATSTFSQSATKIEKNNPEIEKIVSQIEQLSAENKNFKQQIAELSTSSGQEETSSEEIEYLQKEQRKLKKAIVTNEAKLPIVAYLALGLAVLSLLTHGLLNVLGFGPNSNVEALTELVTTLEEEVEIISAQGGTADNSLLEKRLNTLTEKNDRLNNQLAEINGTMLNNSSGPAVADLLEKNLQAQKTVDQLLNRVEQLEKGKITPKQKNKVRKKINPVAVVESNRWFVNLVSFKQEWFARKKAAEFEKKGVPTQVVPVKVNTENWFRLRVIGFTSKYDAASYAVKVKKTLDLSSVWVTND